MGSWPELSKPAPDAVTVAGVEVRTGSRVVLRPRSTRDILARHLDGRRAIVDTIMQDVDDDAVSLTVTLEDDPARDLGKGRQIGHRFFFATDEIDPLPDTGAAAPPQRILVAGIGNVFMGDDGFGVEVAARLAQRQLPEGVDVVDFGIRGMDLVYALGDGYDAALLVDASPRGQPPGTIEVIEPEPEAETELAVDAHGMDPVRVLTLARQLGPIPPRTLVIGCEPQAVLDPQATEEVVAELSPPVRAAVDEAAELVESLLEELGATNKQGGS
ncbi:MAG: hydrogenase maturation protease [Actinomycetota bacterium]|nr:hydrogenase maturation protease [Actinomycetota bacterium]